MLLMVAAVVIMLVAMMNTAVFASAQAEGNDEAANQEYVEKLKERIFPEQEPGRSKIWAVNIDGVARESGLVQLSASCYINLGYYYIGSDGEWHWNTCNL